MAELMGGLLMAPDVVWSLTLRELDAIIAGRTGLSRGAEGALSSRDLMGLMHRYPDAAPTNSGA